MFTRIKSPLLALLCLLLSVLCQAQNEVYCDLEIKKSAVSNNELGVIKQVIRGEFMFRKMEKWRVVEFTDADADLIVDYFLKQEETIACQAKTIDKTVKVFAMRPEEGEDPSFKEHLVTLEEIGYFTVNFRQSNDIVVFPMENCSAAISIRHFEEEMAPYTECPSCGQVVQKDRDESDFLKVKDVNLFEGNSYQSMNMKESFSEATEQTEESMSMKESFSEATEQTEESMSMKESFSDTTEGTEESMNMKESFSEATEQTEESMNMKEFFSEATEQTEESMNMKESFSDTIEEDTEENMNTKEPFSERIEDTEEKIKKSVIIENVIDTSSVQIKEKKVIEKEEIKLSNKQLPLFEEEKPVEEKEEGKTTIPKKDH
ncbi:MAG: hypothetical protein ACPGVB_03280 [Chitinophagales bacterium]